MAYVSYMCVCEDCSYFIVMIEVVCNAYTCFVQLFHIFYDSMILLQMVCYGHTCERNVSLYCVKFTV